MNSDTFIPDPARIFRKIPLHRAFFIFFLFSLPFSVRKVLLVLSENGVFNEYTDISVYLSDLFLVATLLLYVLGNKSYILSRAYWRKMFHVEHLLLPICIPAFFLLWSGLSIFWSESNLLALASFARLAEGYLLYLYIILSNVPRGTFEEKAKECSMWNKENSQGVTSEMFHVEQTTGISEKILPCNVPRGTLQKFFLPLLERCSTWNNLQLTLGILVFSAFFQSIAAILQFIWQRSLGLTLLGESVFSVDNPGIAKIVISGDIFVRAYGFFPHPNILGGFLAMSLLATMAYPLFFARKLFHVEHWTVTPDEIPLLDVPRGTSSKGTLLTHLNCSTWNNRMLWVVKIFKKLFHVEQFSGIWLYRVIVFTQILALLLSFSKSAWLAFVMGLLILTYSVRKLFHVEQLMHDVKIVPRGTMSEVLPTNGLNCSTWNNLKFWITHIGKKMFHVEQFVVIGGIILFGMVIFFFDLRLFLIQPSVERLFYMNALTGLTQNYFIQGVGVGQFVLTMQQFFAEKLLLWQFQPIHDVFLLIFSETGVVGLSLFLWFFVYVSWWNNKNVPRGTIVTHHEGCSTWNNRLSKGENASMFHVEHRSMSPHSSFVDCERVILTSLLQSILVAVTVIMLFDHYFWDIQQGQLLLWIVLALAVPRK